MARHKPAGHFRRPQGNGGAVGDLAAPVVATASRATKFAVLAQVGEERATQLSARDDVDRSVDRLLRDGLAHTQVKAGKLRALGVTGPTRSPRYPDLPIIGETLPGFEMLPWYGLFAPTGIPTDALTRLRVEVSKFLANPEAQAKMNAAGPEVWMVTPEQFSATIRRDYERNGKVVKALDVRMD